jgi:hypothetical protein
MRRMLGAVLGLAVAVLPAMARQEASDKKQTQEQPKQTDRQQPPPGQAADKPKPPKADKQQAAPKQTQKQPKDADKHRKNQGPPRNVPQHDRPESA